MSYLTVKNISKSFKVGLHKIKALQNISLEVEKGECHAIVGESGSGKSTLGNVVLGIYKADSGDILFNGQLTPRQWSMHLRQKVQLVQQNPLSALNPKKTIGQSLILPIRVHNLAPKSAWRDKACNLLEEVKMSPDLIDSFPSSLSGGQRQRVAIARALAADPELIVLDEPTSALDVLVQYHVLKLLQSLQKKHNLTYIFITHDLAVVRNIANNVSVFEAGKLVESAKVTDLFSSPKMNYTKRLIGSIPVISASELTLRDHLASQ